MEGRCEMTEWIVPLTGLLIYLFLCPGCFLWVWLYNRNKAVTEEGELKAS